MLDGHFTYVQGTLVRTGKLWAVVAAVAFCPQSEFSALVGGECLEEGLHEFPDEGGSRHGRGGFIVPEGEAGPDRLIHVEHVGV